MADQAHEWTDEEIERLERRFRRQYNQASREMRKRLDDMMESYDKANAEWKQRVKSGDATQEDYDGWLKGQATDRAFVQSMAQTLAQDANRTNQIAMDTVNDAIPSVFAENANYAAFEVERGIGYETHAFDLYDQSTVRRLIRDQPDLLPPLPEPKMDNGRDLRWNRQRFAGVITQSVLQGESIPRAADRIGRVMRTNEAAATRAARTALTGAENAGRVDSYRRAQNIGIELEQEWLATHDERTRITHRLLDGEHVPVGERFVPDGYGDKYSIGFPGDPTALGEMVYNCRCTLVAWLPSIAEEDNRSWAKMPDGMTYDEWKHGKKQEQKEYKYTSGSSQIWGQLGDNDPVAVRKKVDQFLQGAAENAAEVWSEFEARLIMLDPTGAEGAFFRWGDGVSVDVARELTGDTAQKIPMNVFFHEFGHHIDNVAGGTYEISSQFGNGKFGKTITREVEGYINRKRRELVKMFDGYVASGDYSGLVEIGAIDKFKESVADALFNLESEMDLLENDMFDWLEEDTGLRLSGLSKGDAKKALFDHYAPMLELKKPSIQKARDIVSDEIIAGGHEVSLALGDIFEGATKGKCVDTWGHGVRYWGVKGNNFKLSCEAFAEFYSAECVYSENPAILDTMKERLPESYKVYRQIMESIA